ERALIRPIRTSASARHAARGATRKRLRRSHSSSQMCPFDRISRTASQTGLSPFELWWWSWQLAGQASADPRRSVAGALCVRSVYRTSRRFLVGRHFRGGWVGGGAGARAPAPPHPSPIANRPPTHAQRAPPETNT